MVTENALRIQTLKRAGARGRPLWKGSRERWQNPHKPCQVDFFVVLEFADGQFIFERAG
jgi:hypothetical protein